MLASLHALLLELLEFPVPVLVAVRGQCLGGGLELALSGSMIFATPASQLGQPEIKLGVFAPAASVLLPYRVSQPVAEGLLLSGRSISGTEALSCGLVQVLAEDPEAAALAWFEQHLQDKSAAALACAVTAARGQMLRDVRWRLAEVEHLYMERLMKTHDANEGLAAFMAKRQPVWTHQ
jgi:cyclohexa-1,5-dienecarbonyl-CoA hydratase